MELHYLRVYESVSGGWVDLHPLHGTDELPDNLEACKLLAQKGYRLQLLPCLNQEALELRQKLLPEVFGNKNPDVRINNKAIADIKKPNNREATKTSVKNAIYRAAQQRVEIVIINLHQASYSFSDIKEALLSTLRIGRNSSIREAWIITHDNNVLIIPKKMINTKSFYAVLNCL
ncbi:hypothetical protein D3H65_22660 [Paraflavitalea soli]|uniref:tRNA nuclease CdiA C-terminal domain-containing protein n=1 Tax=Paraflavitalea soli TaxID=2315862 RepID=A0A3B7MS09_9BACT|nr:hypothetical protein [Paraflavitalea soli]AXY76627.1 hypothetical protein D3H65_22660 [Paraflavitalea soli]